MKLNKWIDPTFWAHPTPVNLSLLVLIMFLLFYIALWLIWLFSRLPMPPF